MLKRYLVIIIVFFFWKVAQRKEVHLEVFMKKKNITYFHKLVSGTVHVNDKNVTFWKGKFYAGRLLPTRKIRLRLKIRYCWILKEYLKDLRKNHKLETGKNHETTNQHRGKDKNIIARNMLECLHPDYFVGSKKCIPGRKQLITDCEMI